MADRSSSGYVCPACELECDKDTHLCEMPSGRGHDRVFAINDIVKVIVGPETPDVPDLRGDLGEVRGIIRENGVTLIDVEFGPDSPAPEGFRFLPEHLTYWGRWPSDPDTP